MRDHHVITALCLIGYVGSIAAILGCAVGIFGCIQELMR